MPLEQKRVIYAEGEDEARAARRAGGAGRRHCHVRSSSVARRSSRWIKKAGLNLEARARLRIVNPESDRRYRELWTEYQALMKRDGVTDLAKAKIRRDTTMIGVMMVHRGDADALVCGTFGDLRLPPRRCRAGGGRDRRRRAPSSSRR